VDLSFRSKNQTSNGVGVRRHNGLLKTIGLVDCCERQQLAVVQNASALTVKLYDVGFVCYKDECAVFALLEEFNMTPFMEAHISYDHCHVNQEAIEFDSYGQGKGKS